MTTSSLSLQRASEKNATIRREKLAITGCDVNTDRNIVFNASLMSVYLLSFSKFKQPRLNLSWQAGSEGLVEDESNSPHINLLLQIVAPLSTPHCHSSILAHNVADSYSFFLWTSVSMKFLKCKTAKRGTFYMCDECMMSALVSLSSLAERRRS